MASKRSASIVRPRSNAVNQFSARRCVILPERCAYVTAASACFTYLRLLNFRDSYYARRGLLDCLSSDDSTTGATGCFTFRAAFFTGAGLGLALAAVRFAALATLRALLRLAEFALRSLARPCTFDPFLRLAMIGPLVWLVCVTSYPQGIADQTTNRSLGNLSNEFSRRERVPCL